VETTWKRPKEIPSKTFHIETQEGTLHLTLGYEDERLIEVRAMIGKAGTYAQIMLDTIAKLISMYLQSPEARYKIVKKFNKQFAEMFCGMEEFEWQGEKYQSAIDLIVKIVITEVEKQVT